MPSSWLLISNATVVDGAGNAPVPNASVLVKDSEISAVGAAGRPRSGPAR